MFVVLNLGYPLNASQVYFPEFIFLFIGIRFCVASTTFSPCSSRLIPSPCCCGYGHNRLEIQVSVWEGVESLDCMPRSGMAGSYGRSSFNFWRFPPPHWFPWERCVHLCVTGCDFDPTPPLPLQSLLYLQAGCHFIYFMVGLCLWHDFGFPTFKWKSSCLKTNVRKINGWMRWSYAQDSAGHTLGGCSGNPPMIKSSLRLSFWEPCSGTLWLIFWLDSFEILSPFVCVVSCSVFRAEIQRLTTAWRLC